MERLQVRLLIAGMLVAMAVVACGASGDADAGMVDERTEDAEPVPGTETATEAETVAPIDLGNEYCPVMGGSVVEGQYADWNGYRIGICCPPCAGAIEEDPLTYIAVLAEDPGISEEHRMELLDLCESGE